MKFIRFLKSKNAIGALFMGIFYAIIMLGINLTGYSAIPKGIDKLSVAIVNDDAGQYGATIAEQFKKSLPFKNIVTNDTNDQAMKNLANNDLVLVIHIPNDFSSNLQKGQTPSINFTNNGATASTVTSSIKAIVTEINNKLSTQFAEQTAQGMLTNLQIPQEQATELAKKIESSYSGNIVTINPIPSGMNNNMLPMFLTMAGYTGAMIGSMQLVAAYRENRKRASKKRLFIYLQLTALLIAVVSSVVGSSLTFLLNKSSTPLIFSIFAQQILNYMVFFNFTAITNFLLGESGMLVNLPILLGQTLANGFTIPREMMLKPFKDLSYISPMYYSVQAYFAKLYGSISSSSYIKSLILVGLVALLINILIVAVIHRPVEVKDEDIINENQFKIPA